MSRDPAPLPIAVGQTVGHYTILEALGKGGMGEVFAAQDTRLDRKVAVKVLPVEFATDTRRLKRFETEAKALAALNHPNIVSVFSIEEISGRLLLIMELVEGRTLRELIPEAGMPVPHFLEIAAALADAIGAAHERGVMHRDLKPENIMLTPSGRVKILDFGLAKFREDALDLANAETRLATEVTTDGAAVGTAPYMSPEHLEGEPVDSRSDVFSLGVVFHEMLTGRQPFRGRTMAQVLSAILRDDPAPITTSRPDLPVALAHLVMRCLHKRPDGRIDSAATLHANLKQIGRQIERDELNTPEYVPTLSGRLTPADESAGVGPAVLNSRFGLTAIIAGLLAINWAETNLEELWTTRDASWIGYDFAQAFTWAERGLSFDRHDLAGPVAVYAGSIAYFFVPALLLAWTMAAMIPRATLDGYRVFVLAIVVCYCISLPFYLFLPVPERWAFPDSQAVLLSDLWSTELIETIRPISGLDNCFPSFHVSGTFATVLVWYLFGLRYRHAVAFLGSAVAISTILLGIHWLADVVAGLALAVIGVRTAVWLNERVREPSRFLPLSRSER